MAAIEDRHGGSPLGQGNDLLAEPLIVDLAGRYGVSPGELVIAWHVAMGLVTIPKSSDPIRLAQNLAAADLELDPSDVEALLALDGTEPHPADPDVVGH